MRKKKIIINDEEELNDFIKEALLLIKNEINKSNKKISGVLFEIFRYNDYEDALDDRDYNEMLYSFLTFEMLFSPDSFYILGSEGKMYDFVFYMMQRKCLKILLQNNGGIEIIRKDRFDFRVRIWIKKLCKSRIKGEKSYLRTIEINNLLKIVIIKYN